MQDLDLDPKGMAAIPVKAVCSVTGAWVTSKPELLQPFRGIYTEAFVKHRMKWLPGQPLTVLELSARRFQRPLMVPNDPGFWGCFSWASVPTSQALHDAVAQSEPAIDATTLQRLQAQLRRALQHETELPLGSSDV